MDKRKGILNIGTSIVSRIVLLLATLFVRRLLIMYIGNEANGLNSLYASIIGMLSVAELGVGSAIVFSMYKPIVDGDDRTVTALYRLYRRLYRIIGAVILAAGMAVMPFLPRLIKDYENIGFNVFVPYLLTLISVFLSYMYGAKTSLIQAYKDNYIIAEIVTVTGLLRSAMQIAAILIFRSYTAYLICSIIETGMVWIMTDRAVRKQHPEIVGLEISDAVLGEETKRVVSTNIKAMFLHKIGAVMVGAVDSLIISAFIGVAILGKYSNYTAITSAMFGVIVLFFTPLTSVIGHMCATQSSDNIRRYFDYFYSLNYVLGVVFFLGYYAVIDNLIAILFGPGLNLDWKVSFVITLNSFISYMRNAQLLFRDAAGAFYYDRWKPFFEGVSNLILSVILVKALPEDLSVVGVVAATIITSLLICDIVEPHILFKYVFKQPAEGFCFKNYSYIAAFTVCLIIMEKLKISFDGEAAEMFVNGIISTGISAVLLLAVSIADKTFRRELITMADQASRWIKTINRRKDGSEY